MTAARLRQSLQSAPLTLHLVSGRKFAVPHTDYASVSPNGSFVIVYDRRTAGELFEVVSVKEIESVSMRTRHTAG